ncbi:MAG TPA: CNNM domain-containing protein, partial [Candidatus Krumholzibacterium sp.]|nr:CNNM domain-containing protein [Candidatus Krumholzibacterium sp.]
MDPVNAIVIIILSMLLTGFFAGSETAMVSCSRIRLRNRAQRGSRRAKMVEKLLASPEQFFSIVLVGTNLAVIVCTATATALAVDRMGQAGALAATVIMTPLLLIFGEVVPKVVYLYHSDRIAVMVAPLLRIMLYILWPIVVPVTWMAKLLTGFSKDEERKLNIISTREELIYLYNRGRDGMGAADQAASMIDKVFQFRVVKVRDLMIPMSKVVSFPVSAPVDKVIEEAEQHTYSRYPLRDPESGLIVGVISTIDLLGLDGGERLSTVMRKPFTTTRDEYADRLLIRMKDDPLHIAIVTDDEGS